MIKMNIVDLKLERSDFFVLLEQCRKNKEFTDVQLQIGDKLFDAHRIILSLYSPVLKAMISDQWSTTKICPISEESVDVEIVEDLLSFLYTGSIQLTADNVHPVCVAAHFLQISTLLEPSLKHLCQLVTIENVLTLFEFSITYQLEPLRLSCHRFISKNSEEVFQDSRVIKLAFNDVFKELIVGLKGFQTKMLRENTFDCIVRWTEENLVERLDQLPVLLADIALNKFPLKFLTETVSNHPLVNESTSGMKAVAIAIANYNTVPNLIVSGCEDEFCEKRSIFHYDPLTGVWGKIPDMQVLRENFAFTIVNEKDIIVCGGIGFCTDSYDGVKLRSVEMFEWATKSWKKLPDMPHPTEYCSMTTLNGNLYVAGGIDHPDSPRSAVVCYSLKTQQWRYVKPMNYGRDYCQLVEYNSYLYVFGGGTHVVEQYDPVLDEWTVQSTSEVINYDSIIAATVHQEQIYVIPAALNRESGKFNPETNVWTKFPELKHPRNRALVSTNERLLAVLDSHKWIYEFDFSAQKWEKFCRIDANLTNPELIIF